MQYNKPNLDSLQDYLNNSQSQQSEVNWWSIPQGMSSIRVLPPWDPTGRIALCVYSHRIEYKDPESNYTKYSWTCLDKTFGKPCNICAGLKRVSESGVSIDEYLPTTSTYYINALVMYDPAYESAVKSGRTPGNGTQKPYSHVLMRVPKTVYSWVVSQITSPLVGDITDPETGCDVVITREGTGINTRYSCTLSPNGRTAIPKEVLDSIELYDLDAVFSTGFDDSRVTRMIDSLCTSAQSLQQQVPQFQPQPIVLTTPTPQVPQSPYGGVPTPTPQVPQSPYGGVPTPTPQASTGVLSSSGDNLPKCYGHHDPMSVTCVVCPHEIPCSQKVG